MAEYRVTTLYLADGASFDRAFEQLRPQLADGLPVAVHRSDGVSVEVRMCHDKWPPPHLAAGPSRRHCDKCGLQRVCNVFKRTSAPFLAQWTNAEKKRMFHLCRECTEAYRDFYYTHMQD